ncbi:MAG: hypothetical protein IPM54_17840 [Polyangiaceae bacterium]|nr:hypothetical protein [Polyangiaceae bacterium]
MRIRSLSFFVALASVVAGCSDEVPYGSSLADCEATDPFPLQAGETIEADSCYRFARDTFSFPNYVGGPMLGPKEMAEVFGTGVCSKHLDTCSPDDEMAGYCTAGCILTPQARRHMDEYNSAMNGGHCDGLSAMSQLIHTGYVDAQTFGSSSAHGLSETDGLRREIARWWTTQVPVQQRGASQDKTPGDALKYLDSIWNSDGMATLWIHYITDGHTAAHAITPYAITHDESGTRRIYVYDSNDPTGVHFVEIDQAEKIWSYQLTNGLFAGTDHSPKGFTEMRFVADADRTDRYCWFCEESFADKVQDHVVLGGDMLARLEDEAGSPFVEKSAEGVWNLLNAELHFPFTNLDDQPLPSIVHDVNAPYKVRFTGASIGGEPGRLLVSSPGSTVGIEGIFLMPDQHGIATVHPDTNEIEYAASGTEEATLHVTAHHDAADYEFTLTIKAQSGHTMRIKNDEVAEILIVDLEAVDTSYDVTLGIERHMQGQLEKATFTQVPHGAVVEYTITYGEFKSGISVDVDIDKNGIDFTETWMP